MNDVDSILFMAAAYLRAFGWTQDGLTTSDGSACLVGAIYMVAPALDAVMIDSVRLIANRIGLDGDKLGTGEVIEWVAVWNDEPGRTIEEVLNVLQPAPVMDFEPCTEVKA